VVRSNEQAKTVQKLPTLANEVQGLAAACDTFQAGGVFVGVLIPLRESAQKRAQLEAGGAEAKLLD
jgi:hypothetical protein